jgi:integrase
MASLTTDPKGNRTVQFVAGNGKRRSIRLGKIPVKAADSIRTRVEYLNAAKVGNFPLDTDTAAWLAKVGDDLHAKLAAVGLIAERIRPEAVSLGGFLRRLIEDRADAKPRTRINLDQAARKLTAHFGADAPLASITPAAADGWAAALRKEYAPAYVARLIKFAKQFFHAARRAGLVAASPFDGIKAGSMANPERLYFVSREDALKLIEACPDAEWRLIVALARFGGLRCPSELLALTWADIDWARGRFLVRAPKTAHHADGGRRWVPLFPELRPHLEAAFEAAEPGTVYVVGRSRSHETNLRTTFERIIYRAGLLPWPKPFQNLRSSRETELVKTFPLHVVTAWIGNSALVAAKHYLQVTEADFHRAAGPSAPASQAQPPVAGGAAPALHNPVQSGAAKDGQEGIVVPADVEKGRRFTACHLEASADVLGEYTQQESNLQPSVP